MQKTLLAISLVGWLAGLTITGRLADSGYMTMYKIPFVHPNTWEKTTIMNDNKQNKTFLCRAVILR